MENDVNSNEDKSITILESPIMFLLLSGLYPVLFVISNNWHIYSVKQYVFLLVIPFITLIIGIILKIISLIINKIIRKYNWNKPRIFTKYKINIYKITAFILGLFSIFILMKSTITNNKSMMIVFLIFTLVSVILIYIQGYKYPNTFIIIMSILASINIATGLIRNRSIEDYILPSLNSEEDRKILFKDKPNVYLVHLESYHSPQAMKHLYGYDNKEFLEKLEDMGFDITDNVYSNYANTLISVGSMFLMKHHYENVSVGRGDALSIRDMIIGEIYNPVLSIFKNNGYNLVFLHPNIYLFRGNGMVDYHYPEYGIHDALTLFQSDIVNKIRAIIFKVEDVNAKETWEASPKELESLIPGVVINYRSRNKPTFFYVKEGAVRHTMPDGSYSWKDNGDEWTEFYLKILKASNPKILKRLDWIIENDPKAIIILYGDHGALRYRDVWKGDNKNVDINDTIRTRMDLSSQDLAYDLFGVFLAIRSPGYNIDLKDKDSHVNIFKILFSYLAEDKELLNQMEPNVSYLKYNDKLFKFVEDGTVLPNIKQVEIPEQ